MRAVLITQYGGPDVLKVQTQEPPQLGRHQIRIDVKAAGVNFADIMSRLGQYPHSLPAPCIGGYEAAGTVTEVGEDVPGLKSGDRVTAVTRDGAYAEQICVSHTDVIPLPEWLSFAEGAAVPINYATAWAGVIGYGSLRPGERVLIKAAAGGVGIAATQLAKHVGAEVYGAASPSKQDAIRSNGVDVALDYTNPEWARDLPQFDLVMDAIGGQSFKQSFDLLRPGGRLFPFGAVSLFDGGEREGTDGEPDDFRILGGLEAMDLLVESKAIIGMDLRVLWNDRDTLEPWLSPLVPLLDARVIRPHVSHEVRFDDAPEAHRILSDRRNIGKVVLVP